jgi:glycerol kinase
MSETTGRAHIARAAVDALGHQVCDVVDVIERGTAPIAELRADGGATAADLVMQTQADLLGKQVQVGAVAEVSALGAARLAWVTLGEPAWPVASGHRFTPTAGEPERQASRLHWAGELRRAGFDGASR